MDPVMALFDEFTSKLAGMSDSNVVVGQPIVLGETTVVPLSRVRVGLGGGGAEGEGDVRDHGKHKGQGAGKGVGQGVGGGAKVRPVAVAVFGPHGVKIVPIPGPRGALDRALDKLPDLVDAVKAAVDRARSDDA